MLNSISHSELIAILECTILDSNGMDHRVTVKPVLTTVRWDILGVWAVPQINSTDVSWNFSGNFFFAYVISFMLLFDRSKITHEVGIPGWVLIQDSIKEKQCWLVKEPLKSISKNIDLLFRGQALEILKMVKIILSKLDIVLGLVLYLLLFLFDVADVGVDSILWLNGL